MKNKIICGFAGIGKSYLAKEKVGWVDLESTPFDKNWDLYTDVAIHMQENGYTPMVSCHIWVRKALKEKGADYVVVIPKIEYKKAYIEKYKQRGDSENFLRFLSENWDKFINEIIEEEENVIVLQTEKETLSDINNINN